MSAIPPKADNAPTAFMSTRPRSLAFGIGRDLTGWLGNYRVQYRRGPEYGWYVQSDERND